VTALRVGVAGDVDTVAEIHATRIRDGFLVQLGLPFLRRLYRRAVRSSRAFVIVSRDGGEVTGFVAVAEDTHAFYREFLRRDGIIATAVALPRIVRALRSVVETLRYGTRDHGEVPKAEILAIAVRERFEGVGLGTELVVAALDELSRRGVPSARVVTAVGNTAAVRAYERAGFRPDGIAYVHRDVPQTVLVWK
jgi:ribosomal protein S18 acetylase RimI-like enzyme